MLDRLLKIKLFIAFILLYSSVTVTFGQQQFPYKIQNRLYTQLYEKWLRLNDTSISFAIQPFYNSNPNFSTLLNKYFNNESNRGKKQSIIKQTFRVGNMFNAMATDGKSNVTINPLFGFEIGKTSNGSIYNFNRGIRLDASIDNKVFISSSFYENLSRFPTYINQYIDSLTVVPGMGKARNDKNNQVEYAIPIGYIGYKPSEIFYFELGNDKNFIGNGHRSLLLSDIAYSYPYFKMQTRIGKFSFQTIWAQFVDASRNWANMNGYDKKYGAFNTVSYTGFKNLELNLFQSVIWNNKDSLGNKRDQEWGYFVPIIFFNTLNFNNGSPDNTVIGADISYTIKKYTVIYGQLVVDDFNVNELRNGRGYFQNKYGIQLGVKLFKPFKLDNAFARIEFNTVRPYTYANKIPAINYTHYGEALAHPLGANFRELLFDANYKIKRFLVSSNIVLATYGADSSNSDWGKNIYKSDYLSQTGIFSFNNKIAQGVKTNLLYANASIRYLMNPITNSGFSLQLTYRKEKSNLVDNNDFIYSISFSTNLINVLKEF
ncbi:MAG: hypothetical protein JST94_08620 [Bacteroidetes bacterium]|nr:hypothetical protein [Bacteroidota bacterium]